MKKILSLLLAVIMLLSANAVAYAAAAEPTGYSDNTLTFDVESAGWKNFNTIYCHIWEYGGDAFYAYGSKKEKCTDNGDGTWTYDLDGKGITLDDGVLYALIFANENGMMTYNLLFDKSVLGDTAYCEGTIYESPSDSSKKLQAVYWRGQDKTMFGPELCITPTGNVVGSCVPYTTSTYSLFVQFLEYYLDNARAFSGKDDQALVDDIAKALGLNTEDVKTAINETDTEVYWKDANSTLPGYGSDDAVGGGSSGLLLGDVDGDNDVSIMDATTIQRLLARLLDRPIRLDCADVDGDGDVSILDATKIQRYLAKLIPEL